MEKKIFNSIWPYLSFNEVFEQYEYCTKEKLFHEAAEGNLTIYFDQMPLDMVAMIGSLSKKFVDLCLGINVKFSKEEVEAMFPIFKDCKTEIEVQKLSFKFYTLLLDASEGKSDGLMQFMEGLFNPEDIPADQEMIKLGPLSVYAPIGWNHLAYMSPTEPPCPISRITFIPVLLKSDDPPIFLTLSKEARFRIGVSDDSNDDFFIFYKPNFDVEQELENSKGNIWKSIVDKKFNLKNALADNKLLVKKADIDRLNGLSPDENLSVLFENPNFPEELKIAITAWQSVQYNKPEGIKPRKQIEDWLEKKHPELSGSAFDRIATIANWGKEPGPQSATKTPVAEPVAKKSAVKQPATKPVTKKPATKAVKKTSATKK